MKNFLKYATVLVAAFCFGQVTSRAWDYEGHRLVNQIGLASLPSDFPAFAVTPAAKDRIAFLAGEPDRWRNTTDPTLNHFNGPDHYMDLEQLEDYQIDVHNLPEFRYDFVAQLALARAAHPTNFPPIDAAKDKDHTRQLVGFVPWAIVENFDKLKSEFSYLKTFEESGGTPEEIANAQQNIIYIMGVMGHYVGDAAQPLHTTKHHHGWVGENPHGYNTQTSIHAWIDGGYFGKTGIPKVEELKERIHPAQLVSLAYPAKDTFSSVVEYLLAQQKFVEPLYQMDKAGKLSGTGEVGREGKDFLTGQMVKGGEMLADLWLTAWQQAPKDTFLAGQLARRKLSGTGTSTRP